MLYRILALLVVSTLVLECWSDTIPLTIEDGKISGFSKLTRKLNRFYTFMGIPYAKPPVDDLRFKAPVAAEKWEGIRDASNFRNICYQVNFDADAEDEDCLFVNVFTPHVVCESFKYPVLVYIHGGEFIMGNSWAGPDFFMEGDDVVFVTFNYRLGPFGFLTTEDSVIPGNAGLKDQVLALQWVQNNIHHFCGDAGNVTLFGIDAGAASISYHLLSPQSEGLFSRAIIQSGSALSPWAFQRDMKNITFQLADIVSPSDEERTDSSEVLKILQEADARMIDNASFIINSEEKVSNLQIQQGFYFAPVLEVESDEAFLTQYQYENFKNGSFNQVPTIIGIAEEEFLGYVTNDTIRWYLSSFESDNSLYAPRDLNADEDQMLAAGKEIKEFYNIDGSADFNETLEALGVKFMSDTSFVRSIVKQASLQSQYSDVYFYVFSYDGVMGDYDEETLPGIGKVKHGEELNYIFSTVLVNSQLDNSNTTLFPENDVLTQERLLKIWRNFALYGNPTPDVDEVLQNITWPAVDLSSDSDLKYLDINEDLTIKSNPRGEETLTFWDSIYETYGVEPFDTY